MVTSQGCCDNIEIKFTSKLAPWMETNVVIYHFSGKDDKGYNIYKSSQNKVLYFRDRAPKPLRGTLHTRASLTISPTVESEGQD